ncbi:DUF7577 domain-containing protein [Halopiger djelfimassiliensis]|uniref:DUF7577 domain-containing protein n=1 Tax=Halopiger djelfimassiliensis TaxID=1293047 RepID=UPI00067824C9|nr:hypothetical protein [Halopiger djelfimassiliensis]
MELWGWLIGYVVLFVLLHLLLYYAYVRRGDGDNTRTPSFADPNRARSHSSPGPDRYPRAPDEFDDADGPETERDLEGETIRCPHCGANNAADQVFTYCWHCISTLRR